MMHGVSGAMRIDKLFTVKIIRWAGRESDTLAVKA